MKHNHPKIEIMDTTLRDGEKTSGVSFVPHEKLMIARLLLEDLRRTGWKWLPRGCLKGSSMR